MKASFLLDEALPLWLQVKGLNPDPSIHSRTIGSWRDLRETQEISEALELDPTEVTAQMLMHSSLTAHEANRSFTLADLLHRPEAFQAQADLCRRLHALLNREDIADERLAFAAQLDAALTHYGVADRADVRALLDDEDTLALLRRDAFKSNRDLTVAQFLQGATGPSTRPGYSTVLRQWWNLNALLEAAVSLPDGVSLHLINAPAATDSFFVFVVRRGANLFVLHDAPNFTHPLQAGMRRKPGRDMEKRVARNWFPYELMGMTYDAEGEVYVRALKTTALVPGGVPFAGETSVVTHLTEMPAAELVWTILVFDLLMDRFWVQALPRLPISYTGQMLKQESALLASAEKAGLPMVAHARPTLAVPDLTLAQVREMATSPTADRDLGATGAHPFAWIEDRFADQVSAETFNVVAAEGVTARLTQAGSVELVVAPTEHEIGHFAHSDWLARQITVHHLPSTAFGTANELQADRAYLARANYVEALKRAANADYAARKDEVLAWYRRRMAARLPFLLTLAGHGELFIHDALDRSFRHFERRAHLGAQITRTFQDGKGASVRVLCHALMTTLDHAQARRGSSYEDYLRHAHQVGPTRAVALARHVRQEDRCAITGGKPTHSVAFTPSNSAEIAFLLGLAERDLPEGLRHLTTLGVREGNPLLNRIDPMIWKMENPWVGLDLRVRLSLSRRGLANVQAGVTPVDLSPLHGVNAAMLGEAWPAEWASQVP